MINKLLALGFLILLVGKLFFKFRFGALRLWFDGVVNAMLIAIVLAYAVQALLLFTN